MRFQGSPIPPTPRGPHEVGPSAYSYVKLLNCCKYLQISVKKWLLENHPHEISVVLIVTAMLSSMVSRHQLTLSLGLLIRCLGKMTSPTTNDRFHCGCLTLSDTAFFPDVTTASGPQQPQPRTHPSWAECVLAAFDSEKPNNSMPLRLAKVEVADNKRVATFVAVASNGTSTRARIGTRSASADSLKTTITLVSANIFLGLSLLFPSTMAELCFRFHIGILQPFLIGLGETK